MGVIDQQIMTPEHALEDFKHTEYTRVMSRSLDSYQEIRPDGGVSGVLGQRSTYRINPQGNKFLQDVYIANQLSAVNGGDGTEAFIEATALNMIGEIEIKHRGRKIWQMTDPIGPYLHICSMTKDEKDLNHVKRIMNDVNGTTRETQAQSTGTPIMYLKLDEICPIFSHPLPLSLLDGDIEIHIKYNRVADIVTGGGVGPLSVDITTSYLQVNFIEPPDEVFQFAKNKLRNKGNYSWFSYEFLHTPYPVASGTSSTTNIIGNIADKSVMMLWFVLRHNSDDVADPYNFQRIESWRFKSGGNEIDNMASSEWTHDKFNTFYLGSVRVPNINEVYGSTNNRYFINYVEDLQHAFAGTFSEVPAFHGSYSFAGVSNATLRTDFASATAEDSTLHVTALIPKIVYISPEGILNTYD